MNQDQGLVTATLPEGSGSGGLGPVRVASAVDLYVTAIEAALET
jgi:hypothetical protein